MSEAWDTAQQRAGQQGAGQQRAGQQGAGQQRAGQQRAGGWDDAGSAVSELRGRGLRFVLVAEMMGRRSMTVAEMVAMIQRYGYRLGGRASKVISDALRWEVRRGRVVRLRRGVYAYQRAPAATARRIRIFAIHCHETITGAVGAASATPAVQKRRQLLARLTAPPWADLRWLWNT